MPSPFAHLAAGYIVYRLSSDRICSRSMSEHSWILPRLLIVTLGLSILPDMDSIFGILFGDFGRFHNNGTHSLVIGLVVAVTFASIVRWRFKFSFASWLIIALISYAMHVIMDFFTLGRGVMLFWPFSWERYLSPVPLFYGLHWSDGIISIRHFWTLITEMGFLIIVFVILQFLPKIRNILLQ